jgi:uncharacterized protein YndB with AHSA1/START domain
MEKIEKRITINASASKVWKAITDKDELKEWMMMPTNFEAVIGKEFTFKAKKNENWDGFIYCKVMEVEINKKLSFSWNAQIIGADTLVTILIFEKGGKTELSLIHTGFDKLPAEARAKMIESHNKGWEERILQKLPELFSK